MDHPSQHFPREEFERSDVAVRLGIDNKMPDELLPAARALCVNVLEIVRGYFGPVIVTSGYRCPALCKAIGSKETSQHAKAEAADFRISGVDLVKVCRWIIENVPEFDQLIFEGTWVHVSFREGANRRQVLTAHFESGKVRYTSGLPA